MLAWLAGADAAPAACPHAPTIHNIHPHTHAAGGLRLLRYGSLHGSVLGLEAVLAGVGLGVAGSGAASARQDAGRLAAGCAAAGGTSPGA